MRFRWLAAVAVALLSTGLAPAQPKAPEPTLEVRLRSVNDLLDRFEYVAGLLGKEDTATQARDLIKSLTVDGKGVEGIDPKKPVGAYATLEQDVATSPFVVMIPIADQEQFLSALKARLDVTAEKGDDGTLKAAVPLLNEVHLRFTDGYLYVSQKAKDLDPKILVSPKVYFAKDDGAAASVVVHIARVPADLRTFLYGQFELGVNDDRKKNEGNETAAEKKLKNLVLDSILSGVKGVSDDGKRLAVKLFADPKTDDVSAEVTLTAKSGSATAKNFAALAGKTSVPAGIVAAEGAAAGANVKLAVTDGRKKEFAAAVDALLAEALKNAPDDQQEVLKALVAAVGPTLKAGELDAAATLRGPDAKGHYAALAALAVKDGKAIEKFAKKVDEDYGALSRRHRDVQVRRGEGRRLQPAPRRHQADRRQVRATVRHENGLARTSDKCLAVSIEPDGKALRAGLKAKAVPVAVVAADGAVAKLLPLFRDELKPDELKALLKDAFGSGPPAGKDTAAFRVTGGDTLTVTFAVKGKAIRAAAGLDLLKGK